jgi:hypothetical protein
MQSTSWLQCLKPVVTEVIPSNGHSDFMGARLDGAGMRRYYYDL